MGIDRAGMRDVPPMSELDEVLTAACRLAFDFSSLGTVSVYQLVARSGLRRRWSEVTVERLGERLADHPDWVSAWLVYSQDKRTSSGWYVIGRDTVEFRVGYFPEAPDRPPVVFDDRVRACAEFIRHEVADIAGLDPRASRWHRWISRLLTR